MKPLFTIPFNRITGQILILSVEVAIIRLLFVDLYIELNHAYGLRFFDFVAQLFRSVPTMLIAVLLNSFFIYRLNQTDVSRRVSILRFTFVFFYVVVLSLIISIIHNLDQMIEGTHPKGLVTAYSRMTFLTAMAINGVQVIGMDLMSYFYRSNQEALREEKRQRTKARLQYEQLKNQLNPHFLFNSLNILDYLVYEDAGRASTFLKKLANVYRYLLDKEPQSWVTLREEIRFVQLYIDLLKERFLEGFEVKIEVQEEALDSLIVPCTLQLLIENATKHNSVDAQQPLLIEIYSREHNLYISNNLQPRLTPPLSTGIGLTSIANQYLSLSDKEIAVDSTNGKFTVSIPILYETHVRKIITVNNLS